MKSGEYYRLLRKYCSEKGLHLKKIGNTGDKKNYPIFSVTNRINRKSKSICFIAGIHGDEIAPSLAILKFIKTFNSERLKNVNIILIPIGNPTGFEAKKRENYLGINLNKHFSDKKLIGENKIIYGFLKKYKFYFVCALHEDLEEKKFYMYNFERKKERIYREIARLGKKRFGVKNGNVEGHTSMRGLITNIKSNDGSIEYRLFYEGAAFAMCTETPGKRKLSERIKFNEEIIKKVIDFAADSEK